MLVMKKGLLVIRQAALRIGVNIIVSAFCLSLQSVAVQLSLAIGGLSPGKRAYRRVGLAGATYRFGDKSGPSEKPAPINFDSCAIPTTCHLGS